MIDHRRPYECRFRSRSGYQGPGLAGDRPFLYVRMGRLRRLLDPAAGRCEFINAVAADERWVVDAVEYTETYRDRDLRVIISDILDADLPLAYSDGISSPTCSSISPPR